MAGRGVVADAGCGGLGDCRPAGGMPRLVQGLSGSSGNSAFSLMLHSLLERPRTGILRYPGANPIPPKAVHLTVIALDTVPTVGANLQLRNHALMPRRLALASISARLDFRRKLIP